MGCRRMLGARDRATIMAGVNVGLSQTRIAHLIGRSPSVVCREIARHTGPDGQYRTEEADKAARAARRRPKKRLLDCDEVLRRRVIADLSQGHTPRQISGRLREEACGTLPSMDTSPDAHSAISHEAIYTWIYAHPKKTLIEHGICLPSRRWMRKKPPAPATNPTSTPSPTSSTTAPEPPSATAPQQKHSTNSLLPPIDTANQTRRTPDRYPEKNGAWDTNSPTADSSSVAQASSLHAQHYRYASHGFEAARPVRRRF